MYLCVQVFIQLVFFHQSWIPVLLCSEFVDLSVQLVLDLFLSWILVMQHHTSPYENPDPSNKTICWLDGP